METLYIGDIKSEDLVDEKYYSFYPTRQHEKSESKWWGPGIELRLMIEQREKSKKEMDNYIIWG